MHEVLEILQQHGLLKGKTPSPSAVERLSLAGLVDMSQEIHKMVTKTHTPISNPAFSFSSSINLSGGTSYCAEIECRTERITQLARFALMYSDKVFVLNPFISYLDPPPKELLRTAKADLLDDLKIISVVAPLLNSGHLGLFSPDTDVCFACQAKEFLSDNASKKYKVEHRKLEDSFVKNVLANCQFVDGECVISLDTQKPYINHERIFVRKGIPSPIIRRPRMKNKFLKGECIPLSQSTIRDLEIHTDLAHEVVMNAMFGLATSSVLHTNFLTEDDMHVSFLNSLHADSNIVSKNRIAGKYLSSIVPFLEDLSLTDVMKVRKRENDSFLLYREALNQAINDFTIAGSRFTIKDAQALHGDVIAPELAVLDKKVRQAKRDLIKKPFRSATALVGMISFGLLTGLISQDISAIANTIGLLKFGGDLVKDTMALGDAEESIKNQPFYFLWKVRQKAKS